MTHPAPKPRLPSWALLAIVCVVLVGGALGISVFVHHIRNQPCLLLVTGNKLCGDDAKTWCEMTAGDRQAVQDANDQFGATAEDDCDAILAG